MNTAGLIATVPSLLDATALVATNVPETEHPEWDPGVEYAIAERRIYNHRVFESAQGGNTGNTPGDPAAADAWWIDVSATNRFRALDLEQETASAQAAEMWWEFTPEDMPTDVHVLGLLDADMARITVTDPVDGLLYDSGESAAGLTIAAPDYWEFFFGDWFSVSELHYEDLPTSHPSAVLRIALTGGAALSVQCIVAGQRRVLGAGVAYGLRVGVDSGTGFKRDRWRSLRLQREPYYKWASFNLRVDKPDADDVADFLTSHRDRVMFWRIVEQFNLTKILGGALWEMTLPKGPRVDMNIRIEGVAIHG